MRHLQSKREGTARRWAKPVRSLGRTQIAKLSVEDQRALPAAARRFAGRRATLCRPPRAFLAAQRALPAAARFSGRRARFAGRTAVTCAFPVDFGAYPRHTHLARSLSTSGSRDLHDLRGLLDLPRVPRARHRRRRARRRNRRRRARHHRRRARLEAALR
jgi:hypothetical protein